MQYNVSNGKLWGCLSGTWALVTGSGGGGSVTSFSAGTLSPLFTTSVATATTTPALSFTLSTAAAQTVLAGPSAYAAAAAGPTYRVLTPQDIPAGYSSCAQLDNAICTSAVDASGNPTFLTTAAGVALPINGGTTPLIMFIGGVYQNLNTNVTLTVPSTASVPQWILAVQDVANANMVAGDFLAMNTPPVYAYTAPTCPSPGTALSATNPAFWFDLSTNLSKTCTSNGGAYSANPSMVIGMIYVDATPKVLNIITEPYRLNPYRRFELFGNGTDAGITVTSGTTTIDVHKQYAYVLVTAGTVTHTAYFTNAHSPGVTFQSQNPVMVIVTGSITASGQGRQVQAAGTGTGAAGNAGGLGGAGGGGGGSGTTSAAGGAGGGRIGWLLLAATAGGGAAGAITPGAGGVGTSAVTDTQLLAGYSLSCMGGGGGNGGGDGTNNGGRGGQSGGSVFIQAPAILVGTGASIVADGLVGANGVGGNAAGGGGGGGGCVILNGINLNTSSGTVTAAFGAGGAKFGAGSGTAGGNGGAGVVQLNRIW